MPKNVRRQIAFPRLFRGASMKWLIPQIIFIVGGLLIGWPEIPPPNVLVTLVFIAWLATVFISETTDQIKGLLRRRRDRARAGRQSASESLQSHPMVWRSEPRLPDLPEGFIWIGQQRIGEPRRPALKPPTLQ
jgi:hypothetical protein